MLAYVAACSPACSALTVGLQTAASRTARSGRCRPWPPTRATAASAREWRTRLRPAAVCTDGTLLSVSLFCGRCVHADCLSSWRSWRAQARRRLDACLFNGAAVCTGMPRCDAVRLLLLLLPTWATCWTLCVFNSRTQRCKRGIGCFCTHCYCVDAQRSLFISRRGTLRWQGTAFIVSKQALENQLHIVR
jgi:hypothetical protein